MSATNSRLPGSAVQALKLPRQSKTQVFLKDSCALTHKEKVWQRWRRGEPRTTRAALISVGPRAGHHELLPLREQSADTMQKIHALNSCNQMLDRPRLEKGHEVSYMCSRIAEFLGQLGDIVKLLFFDVKKLLTES